MPINCVYTFLYRPLFKNSASPSFFAPSSAEFYDPEYSFYEFDLKGFQFPSFAVTLPLSGLYYLINLLFNKDKIIFILYLSIIFISLLFVITSILLLIRAIRKRYEDEKIRMQYEAEEQKYKLRHRFD